MKKHDSTDAYHIYMSDQILKLAPVVGIMAALTFTAARLLGRFAYADIPHLLLFDAVCLSYFGAARILRKRGVVRNGEVSERALMTLELVLDLLILLQWNLITYIFPTRTFWGYAPMFVLLTAFLFRFKAVLIETAGISVAIALSWILKGEQLLPFPDELYAENLILRIVALAVSFGVILSLTYFSEKFTVLVKENFRDIEKKNAELGAMGSEIIDFTADIIEERDSASGQHVKRIKGWTRVLAEQVSEDWPEYGLTEEIIDRIARASVLHDVGKIGIPDGILMKPGKLTPEEFQVIQTHTTIGARVIDRLPDSVGTDYKRYCRDICLFHHEKYDGKGYPAGLKGDEIPIAAQIVSAADCFDALISERPYKPALPGEAAVNMILNGECGAFSDKMKTSIRNCRDKLLRAADSDASGGKI